MALQIDWPLTIHFSLHFTSRENQFCSHLLRLPPSSSLLLFHLIPPFPLTRLSLCSLLVQASMNVWAMTESEASTTSDTWTSKVKWGFLRMFTQNRRGRLRGGKKGAESSRSARLLSLLLLWNGGENLINRITSVNSFESGRHFMCESTCLRCNWVQYKIITGMEESLFRRCQFIQNTFDCHLILLFHMILTSHCF